jgi:hypothetical protein
MYENVAKFDAIVGRLMDQPRTIEYPCHCDGGASVCIVSDMFLGFTQVSFRILDSHSSSITYPTLESGPGVQTLFPNRLARSVTGATLEDAVQTGCEWVVATLQNWLMVGCCSDFGVSEGCSS